MKNRKKIISPLYPILLTGMLFKFTCIKINFYKSLLILDRQNIDSIQRKGKSKLNKNLYSTIKIIQEYYVNQKLVNVFFYTFKN